MGAIISGGVKAAGLDLGHTLMRYDGVPLSWQAHYPAALQAVFAAIGAQAGGETLRQACVRLEKYNTRLIPRETEVTARHIFADVLACAGGCSPAALEHAIDAFFGHFRQSFVVFPDALAFLGNMKAAGLPCGLLTDVPYGMPARWVDKDMEPFLPWLDAALSSVDVGFRKPNTAGFLALARALGVEPRRMAYIGDEEKDIAGAKAAGMAAVLIDRDGCLPPLGEDLRIKSLDEFMQLAL